jgi:outer membrane protein OmpA-like peptidoglycan-associated protein
MKTRLNLRPISSAILCTALCFSTAALAQDSSKTKSNSATSGDQLPDLVELSVFGGVSLFGQVNTGLTEKLITGGTFGARGAYNFSKYIGLELSYNYSVNNVRLVTPIAPGLPSYDFGGRTWMISGNPIFNFTPRGSRVQPYVTVGVSAVQYSPTGDAKNIARSPAVNAVYHSSGLNDNLQVGLNYGGGVKFHLSDHFGLRFDVRGLLTRNPTYGLPDFPTGGIYIPSHNTIQGLQATAGIVFYLGKKYVPPPPAPPPPPQPLSAGSITGAEGTLCQGKAINLHSSASDPTGHTLTYAWKLNGQPSGSNSPDFSFTPNNAGDNTVEVAITDSTNPSRTVTAGPITVSVKDYVEPQITSVSASPNALTCAADTTGTHTATLAASATGSACGGNLSYKWTVSEGSVSSDTSANATFDASSLTFEGGATEQTKTVTATLTVTDETGKSVSKTTDITVKCPAKIIRLSDVVFAKNNARVNNCGKRLLIDELAPRLAGEDYDVVLIGHRDSDEAETTRTGRRGPAKPLDEQRVMNSAAVLSGGTGTCAKVDPSRIKIDWVGTDQTSTPDPALCGTSNRAEQKERRTSRVSDADKNRRVEIYLVPRGSTITPPAAKALKPLPETEVKALGCPK